MKEIPIASPEGPPAPPTDKDWQITQLKRERALQDRNYAELFKQHAELSAPAPPTPEQEKARDAHIQAVIDYGCDARTTVSKSAAAFDAVTTTLDALIAALRQPSPDEPEKAPGQHECHYCRQMVQDGDPFHVHGCTECNCGVQPAHNTRLRDGDKQ